MTPILVATIWNSLVAQDWLVQAAEEWPTVRIIHRHAVRV